MYKDSPLRLASLNAEEKTRLERIKKAKQKQQEVHDRLRHKRSHSASNQKEAGDNSSGYMKDRNAIVLEKADVAVRSLEKLESPKIGHNAENLLVEDDEGINKYS